tara:strand:- start:64511 stop:65629 length:1119 start_codon:yes stop_codon:yes gene_type:complete
MKNILDTGIKNAKNVDRYIFGAGSLGEINKLIHPMIDSQDDYCIFFVDEFFKNHEEIFDSIDLAFNHEMIYVKTNDEPTTDYIDNLVEKIRSATPSLPSVIIGMGGGIALDVAKAIANLLTNPGTAADYQGWDLVKNPSIFKIGIPTLSGTGAETTRTCVLTNKKNGLKLGMNSDFSVYDQIILDPDLTKTVPRNQYFYTGMDAYIHSFEALNGSYRNPIGDAFSKIAIQYAKEVFESEDMQSEQNRSKLMVASYMGGSAIATTYVGLVHPFSAGLSVVFGLHHCVSNCMAMRAMEEFYPTEYNDFWNMTKIQDIKIPKLNGEIIETNLSEEEHKQLYASTIIHEKPLTNALGSEYRKILSPEKVNEMFKMI